MLSYIFLFASTYRTVDQTDKDEMINPYTGVNKTDENEIAIDVNVENANVTFDDDKRPSSDVESLLVS